MDLKLRRIALYPALALAAAAVFLFYGHLQRSASVQKALPAPCSHIADSLKICAKDSDCGIVRDGCCPCTGLGRQCAINTLHLRKYNESLSKECGSEIICPDALSQDSSCRKGVKARCVEGVCRLAP